MGDGTPIEWTDATWNVVNGCSVISPGCTNCYAMKQAHRVDCRRGLTVKTKGGMVWTGETRFNEKVLLDPLRWKRPRRIFVCAHGDLFHDKVPDEWIDRVFAVMALAPQHEFQVLTKRSARMRAYMNRACGRIADAVMALRRELGIKSAVAPLPHITPGAEWWPLSNVWLGVSVEDQARADARIPDLLATPAAVRWISAEPLLGPVDLKDFLLCHASAPTVAGWSKYWVVAGGESGPGARPMHPDWARSLRDQCAAAGVAFLFKQWGEWAPGPQVGDVNADAIDFGLTGKPTAVFRHCARITEADHLPDGLPDMLRVGKKRGGRLLDGVLHDGFPA
jgi:protein gp37